MKKIIYVLLAVLNLIGLVSCSSNDDVTNREIEGNRGREIKLGYVIDNIEAISRSTYNLDTKMNRGDKVYGWIFDSGKEYTDNTSTPVESPLYGATTYVHTDVDRNGELSPLNASGSVVFREYPLNNHSVNIYAVHGNFDGLISQDMAYPTSAMQYSVKTDQSNMDNYSVSDLMYAKTTNVNNYTDTVKLRFSHLLSKISIVPKIAANQSVTIKKIEILNTKPNATLTFNNSNRSTAPAVAVTGEAATITLTGDASNIGSADIENEAILIPQTVGANVDFIKVTLSTGTFYTYKTGSTITFDPGKSYRFVLTLHESPIITGYTVDNWAAGNGGGQTVTADMD